MKKSTTRRQSSLNMCRMEELFVFASKVIYAIFLFIQEICRCAGIFICKFMWFELNMRRALSLTLTHNVKFSGMIKWILSSDYSFVHFSLLSLLLSAHSLLRVFLFVLQSIIELAFSLAHLHIKIWCRKKQVSHFNCHLCLISVVVVLNGLHTVCVRVRIRKTDTQNV